MQFETAVQALCDAGVDFVVIGGVAATLHGSAQVTYDLDICYSRAAANLHRLVQSFSPIPSRPRGIPVGLPFVWDEATLRNGAVFTLQTDIGEIDLLAEVTSLGTFDDVKQHSITVEAFERLIATLDLRALIRAKRATGRAKDLTILAELEIKSESPSIWR
jgi:hypothetical protein